MSTAGNRPGNAVLEHRTDRAVQLSDMAELRAQAGDNPEDGAVTPNDSADRDSVIKLLNYALVTLIDILRDDVVAQRLAIQSFTEAINFIGDDDPTSKLMIESILSAEEQQAAVVGQQAGQAQSMAK